LIVQLLREKPPGYGGVERVAHQLASFWKGPVFSLAPKGKPFAGSDPLPISYVRISLKSFCLSRLYCPFPSRSLKSLLFDDSPLHGHLPSPEVLILLVLAKLIRPGRKLSVHWHSFLDERPDYSSLPNKLYQRIAYWLVPFIADFIVTTSPRLKDELKAHLPEVGIDVLPCSLDPACERQLLAIKDRTSPNPCLRVVFIGRLDSYKRVDWLIKALLKIPNPWQLSVIGDGPKRNQLESLRSSLSIPAHTISFYGRVTEVEKQKVLSESHVLVLPSDRCNEAFGIVQLEAMASGIPALAFDYSRSGMAWVSDLMSLPWTHQPDELSHVIVRLANADTFSKASREARDRYIQLFSCETWRQKLNDITVTRVLGSLRKDQKLINMN
jgi:glycosyltransferase involved in cell wall biosynthesis